MILKVVKSWNKKRELYHDRAFLPLKADYLYGFSGTPFSHLVHWHAKRGEQMLGLLLIESITNLSPNFN